VKTGRKKHDGEKKKKKICYSWQKSGTCKYGPKCRYAHEDVQSQGKSKSPCYSWQATATCRYGDKCKFIHQEAGSGKINLVDEVDGSDEDDQFSKPKEQEEKKHGKNLKSALFHVSSGRQQSARVMGKELQCRFFTALRFRGRKDAKLTDLVTLVDPGSEITLISQKALQKLLSQRVLIYSKKRLGFSVSGLNSGSKVIRFEVRLQGSFLRVCGKEITVKFKAWVYEGHLDQDVVWGVDYFNFYNMSIVGAKNVSDRQLFIGQAQIRAECGTSDNDSPGGPQIKAVALANIRLVSTAQRNLVCDLGVVTDSAQLLEAEDTPEWVGKAPNLAEGRSPTEVLTELGIQVDKSFSQMESFMMGNY
jgi:hypothetical protein